MTDHRPRLPRVGNGQRVRALAPQEFLGELNEFEERNAPEVVHAAGDTSLLHEGRRAAVVGARDAAPVDLERTRSLVRALVSEGVTVVSGLAAGVDTAAHEEAIARGGRTIAVLGTPLDQTYPPSNADLQQTIMERHTAISQFPFGATVTAGNFAKQNRTMALISDATVIVTAGPTSETRHQGWEANRLGRMLFFLEPFAHTDIPWVRKQMTYGAQVLNDQNLDLFLLHLPGRAGLEPVVF